ncbi:hypothetical protein B0H11DRAFT_2259585 [Mycena galericulata]|nr:hypothetical protein B0H11DRAFT_2259585 [Mycena galericulata]
MSNACVCGRTLPRQLRFAFSSRSFTLATLACPPLESTNTEVHQRINLRLAKYKLSPLPLIEAGLGSGWGTRRA